MDTAFRLASDLAKEGCVIVSGMARGIDTAAHTGALHSGGKTIAVLGCGPDQVYPPENRELMDRISKSGAVISEYPPGVKPQTYHFPVRNRIISGICIGVLVVEAGQRSGSYNNPDRAPEQGRRSAVPEISTIITPVHQQLIRRRLGGLLAEDTGGSHGALPSQEYKELGFRRRPAHP